MFQNVEKSKKYTSAFVSKINNLLQNTLNLKIQHKKGRMFDFKIGQKTISNHKNARKC